MQDISFAVTIGVLENIEIARRDQSTVFLRSKAVVLAALDTVVNTVHSAFFHQKLSKQGVCRSARI